MLLFAQCFLDTDTDFHGHVHFSIRPIEATELMIRDIPSLFVKQIKVFQDFSIF